MHATKSFLRLVAATAAASVGGVSRAACDGNSCVGVKIERLYVRDNPTVLISTDDDESKLNCQPVSGRYIELRGSHQKADEIYSLLLAAKLADHDVWIRVGDTPQSPCSLLYVVLE